MSDQAGGSARQEYERRRKRREDRIDQRWGRLAGAVKLLSDDPQSTKAWAAGSEGERRLGAHLARTVGPDCALLHDRRILGAKANIDHLIVAGSGVWVVDAKNYKGLVERRDVAGLFRSDLRLFVGGRDRTKLVGGLDRQVTAVRRALDGVDAPIHAALCFVDADWKLWAKPFRIQGVWVIWPRALSKRISAPGMLDATRVAAIAERLGAGLPPAGRAP